LGFKLNYFFAAIVLYYLGTGPIRGFAVTLAIGIMSSMFTAIVMVRAILDNFVLTGTKTKLSV
jgi:preprotein translocase subunit SecD